jgi:hypothetical protein
VTDEEAGIDRIRQWAAVAVLIVGILVMVGLIVGAVVLLIGWLRKGGAEAIAPALVLAAGALLVGAVLYAAVVRR